MAYVRVTIVKLTTGGMSEILERVGREMAPVFRGQPGFIAYQGVQTGEDAGLTISVWDTQEQADQSAATAGAWIREQLGGRIAAAETHVGEVVFSASREAVAVTT
jgi:heme-degrading monooxygenase HmoA